MAVFEALTLASFGIQALGAVEQFKQDQYSDQAKLETATAQAKLNNLQDQATQQAINEEQMKLMRAFGFDKFQIAKSVRASKAALKAARGGSGSLNDASIQAQIRNIDRIGSNASYVHTLNFGTQLRNLDIERRNVRLRTRGLNEQSFGFNRTANASAFGLKLAGLGIDTFTKVGFETDPTSGKRKFRFGGTGQQVPINPNKPKQAPPLPSTK